MSNELDKLKREILQLQQRHGFEVSIPINRLRFLQELAISHTTLTANLAAANATIEELRGQLAVAVEALEESVRATLWFGCSDIHCSYASPPNTQGTNNTCICHTKAGFPEMVRRIHVNNKSALAAIKAAAPQRGHRGLNKSK